MKLFFIPIVAAALAFGVSPQAPAQAPAARGAAAEESADNGTDAAKEEAAVHKALKKIKFFNGKPNTKAKYYIYLHSASWCGPCCREMPDIVAEYKKLKANKVELILVGHDKTLKEANAYLSSFKAKFPGVLASDEQAGCLPGDAQMQGIPTAFLVTAEGERIHYGHAGFITSGDWRSMVYEHESKNGGASKE